MTKVTNHLISALPADVVGAISVTPVRIGTRTLQLAQPAKPETLLSLESVEKAYAHDEYMPYWATLWPVAKHLCKWIFEQNWGAGETAIELGCGLGLPGVAAAMAGLDVTFTDYDETALRFAAESARLNGYDGAKTMALDWRQPPPAQYDVVIASDLIYEARNIEPLVTFLLAALKPAGKALVADQNRAHAGHFLKALDAAGFVYESLAYDANKAEGYEVGGMLYVVRRGPKQL